MLDRNDLILSNDIFLLELKLLLFSGLGFWAYDDWLSFAVDMLIDFIESEFLILMNEDDLVIDFLFPERLLFSLSEKEELIVSDFFEDCDNFVFECDCMDDVDANGSFGAVFDAGVTLESTCNFSAEL